MGDAEHVAAVKRAARDQRKTEVKARRAQWRRQVRCFWTRPLRHEYVKDYHEDEGMIPTKSCIGCGKGQAQPQYNHHHHQQQVRGTTNG